MRAASRTSVILARFLPLAESGGNEFVGWVGAVNGETWERLRAFAPTAEQRQRVLAAGLEALLIRYGAAFGPRDLQWRFTDLLEEGTAERRREALASEGATGRVVVASEMDIAEAEASGAELAMIYAEEGPQCGWRYRKGTWRPGQLERMHAHYWSLLEAMLERPEAAVGEHDYLTAEEWEAVTGAWAGEARFAHEAESTPGVFEETVRVYGAEVAVVEGGRQVDYATLNAEANRLAHYLMYFSVRPSSVVGIWLEPGVEMVTALLAAMKLGAVATVFDPAAEEEELAERWAALGRPLVIAQGAAAGKAKQMGWDVLDLERERSAMQSQSRLNPGTQVRAEHAAAIVEEGKTPGQGLLLLHRSLTSWARDGKCWAVGPRDTVAFTGRAGTAQGQMEIWGALLNGARLVMLAERSAATAKGLAEALRRHKVNVLAVAAGRFGQWAVEAPEVFASVERLIVVGKGGEKAKERVKAFRGRLQLMEADGPVEAGYTPGRGKNGARFVVDAAGWPVPIGVVGEVCVEGPQLAWGYLADETGTQERFTAKAFSIERGGRMFRTGQLARWTEKGELEVVGAKGKQVTFGGRTVNLDEVERKLMQRACVREAVVVVKEVGGGVERLVAYVVLETPVANLRRTMREELAGEVPEYSLPNDFVVLEAMPLTRDGQVDRASLEAPVSGPRVSGAEADAMAAEVKARTGAREDVVVEKRGWKGWWQGLLGGR